MDNADLAYDMEIAACGEVFRVPRALAVVKRLEGAFGALEPLSRSLSAYAVTLRQLAVLLDVLLADVPAAEGRPTRAEIEAWLFAHGIHKPSQALAEQVLLLVMGNEVLARVLDRKNAIAAQERVLGPFAPAAASNGAIG